MGKRDGRHLRPAELTGGGYASVTGEDLVVVANKNRIGEAEARNAIGDLVYLPR